VASFYPLAEAAERVGGDLVSVTNLTPPGVEPALALLGALGGPRALASPTGGGLHVHRLHVGSVGARQLAAHLRQVPDLGARG
jgi:hypothetical protein